MSKLPSTRLAEKKRNVRIGMSDLAPRWVAESSYAHRGLYDAELGIPENSLAAFDRAVELRQGIFLDTQLSYDSKPVVFADDTLDRMTFEHGPLIAHQSQFLTSLKLRGSEEQIPTLEQVLQLVNGKVPLIVNARAYAADEIVPLCFAVRRTLEGYKGLYAVVSSEPKVCEWFVQNAHRNARGLIVTEAKAPSTPWGKFMWTRRLMLQKASPQFMVFDLNDLPCELASEQKKFGKTIMAMTVKTEADKAKARSTADAYIFEEPPLSAIS
jgi:glycerophosphoryl diester phosphodiesterase